jgi:hypothetical protein
VLRPDGTLLQKPGYDPATCLYLASKVPLEPVPAEPDSGQVTAASEFLLTAFLGDFPWVSEADMANYLGLLVTPILRTWADRLLGGNTTPLHRNADSTRYHPEICNMLSQPGKSTGGLPSFQRPGKRRRAVPSAGLRNAAVTAGP